MRLFRLFKHFLSETSYGTLISDPIAFRHYLELWSAKHPEIFPPEITSGFWFHGFVTSRKLNLRMRRIQLLETGKCTSCDRNSRCPTWLVEQMKSRKACSCADMGYRLMLWLTCLGAPASYWYRVCQGLARLFLVGTTVKDPKLLPVNLVADEKHSWLLGEHIYIPTTVPAGCFLGVDIVESADTR